MRDRYWVVRPVLGKVFAGIVAVVLLIFILSFGWTCISPQEVGVQVNKISHTVSELPLPVGWHLYNRWKTDIIVYHIAAQAYPHDTMKSEKREEYELALKTNDGQNIDVDLTVIFSLNALETPLLHQQVGTNYADQVILPQIRSEARLAIGAYSAEEIYQGKVRDDIQRRMKEKLAAALAKYPAIQIQDTLIRHFNFSPAFEKKIEEKKLAAQQIEINRNCAFAQEEEAKRMKAEALGEKLKAIEAAEGRAQAVKIEADAARYRLEQEALGNLAIYKADAEGKKLQASALGGGKNVVALKFAENIPDKFRVFAVPVGQNSTSLMDLNGVLKGIFQVGAGQ